VNKRTELDLGNGVELAEVTENALITGCFRGKAVILTQHQGRYCALSATCTHMDGPLGEGIVVDGEVHCPWHHARFSVLTGEAAAAPAFPPLACFGTTVRDGRVFVTDSLKPSAVPASGAITAGATPGALPGRVVIVGSGAAGYACAQFLSRDGSQTPVTVISDDVDPPYDRTVCSKQYLIGMQSRQDSLLSSPAQDRSQSDAAPAATMLLGRKVRTLNTRQKFVLLDNDEKVDFDVLVLATGAEPKKPDWPGSDRPDVHLLRTLRDADAIIQSSERARNVAVVGSSFIGLEAAASLQQRKLKVHVVTPERVPLEKLLGSDIGTMIQSVHEEKGVQFHFGREVKSYDGKQLTLDDGSTIPADFVVCGIGVTPRTEIAAAAGIKCASVPGIFAVGDVARYPDPLTGEEIRVEHWVHAQRQGQHVARVILGHSSRYSVVPFFWSAHFDTGLRYLGHVGKIADTRTDGSVKGRNFSRLLTGTEKQKAFITCNRDMASLLKEAEWDAALR
jgi:apoptosis-inducing factor 3